MKLIRYAGGQDDEKNTTVLAGGSSDPYWSYDRVYPERPGTLQLGLIGKPSGGAEPDLYEMRVGATEFGAMLGAMRAEDVNRIVDAFLDRAGPEIVGAVVGRIITHLARGGSPRPAQSTAE